jgi:hypothetical protein
MLKSPMLGVASGVGMFDQRATIAAPTTASPGIRELEILSF